MSFQTNSATMSLRPTESHHQEQQLLAAEAVRQAVERCQIDRVIDLLKGGAPSVLDAEGQTPLHLAAAAGHLSLVEALLQAGCDVSVQDFTGHTALQRAAAEGHVEIIKTLLENGVSVDHQDEVHGNTALHEAAWKGFSQSVQLLCKSKANAYIKNRGGFAPLHLCCQNGHNETCRVLLLAGCKPDIKNNYGDTPLHTGARYGHAGVIRILVSAKCNPSEQNKNGDTALHIAAAMGRRKLTRVLLESNCNRNVKNKQNETSVEIAKRKNLVDIVQILENYPSQNSRNLSKQGFLMDSFSPDQKCSGEFDESSEDDYDADEIIPYPVYHHNNNPNNNGSMMPTNLNSGCKREKSSSSSRETHKRNKTHAAMVHREERQPQRKPRQSSKQQLPRGYYQDERQRRKKRTTKKRYDDGRCYDDEDENPRCHQNHTRDELDSSFPVPRLSEFDEMFQRAANHRQRRGRHDHDHEYHHDPELPKNGEQYYLDLAGNIRRGPAAKARNCNCGPVFSKFEKRLEKDKLDLILHIDKSQTILTSRLTSLEKKTKEQLFGLNQAMKESFAQERGECLDRMERRALRERIAIERQQMLRDMALKRELAFWLDSKLTEIEKKHNLDAKSSAILRALAIKRFSKFRRSNSKSVETEMGFGNLRRAHSEELMSEVGLNNDTPSFYANATVNGPKKMAKSAKNSLEDDTSLMVSDKPRRVRHNSAESAAEMTRKFQHCPEYADFYTGQFEVDLMASRLAGSPLATSEPISENTSSSGVFGLHRWTEDISMNRGGELEVSNRPVYTHYPDDSGAEKRLDLVVRDQSRDDYRDTSQEKYYNHYREESVTPSTENDPKSTPSPFILEETSSYCLSHGLPKPIPKFSGYDSTNGIDVRHGANVYNGHYSQKYNGFDPRDQFVRVNGHVDQNGADMHRAQLTYIPGSSPSGASSSEPTSPAINGIIRSFDGYRNDSSKMNGNSQRIYQNHSPRMLHNNPEEIPPPLPARVINQMNQANGPPTPNHGVIPFFPFHQFPGRSVKPNLAPLTEDDYSQADDHSDFSASQRQKPLDEAARLQLQKSVQHQQGRQMKPNPSRLCDDSALQLNLPLGSDGQGSHDSHNDSGYSTRLGFSAGPSPSLSGSRPESSEGEAPAFNGVSSQSLLLDPMAINMMPPEFEKPVSKQFHLDSKRPVLETKKLQNGIRHLQLVDTDLNFNAFSTKNNNFVPKGSLV